jgi:predicted dehydrogenase
MSSMTEDRIEPNWRIPEGRGRELGIGIVGCGGIVQQCHLPAYQQAGLRVVAVHDANADRARTVARDFGITVVAETVEDLVRMADVDIVDIAVPPWAQPDVVAMAAAAGRHILCQKPLALELDQARKIVETAEGAGVLLGVNQQMRWDAGIAASRDLIAKGAIGRATAAHMEVAAPGGWDQWPWLAAAPQLDIMYHTIHYLDAMRAVLGEPEWITSIHGRYPNQAPVQGETLTNTVLEYPDGLQVLISMNHFDEHGTPFGVFRFVGTEGALDGTIGAVSEPAPYGRPDTLSLRRAGRDPISYDLDTRWFPDAFLGPMADLMDAIAGGRAPQASGRDNLGTLALVIAAYRSAAERRSIRVEDVLSE